MACADIIVCMLFTGENFEDPWLWTGWRQSQLTRCKGHFCAMRRRL